MFLVVFPCFIVIQNMSISDVFSYISLFQDNRTMYYSYTLDIYGYFQIERDMIVVMIFLLIMSQRKFRLVNHSDT